MLIDVEYADGERVLATGYIGARLVLQLVPRGPLACYGDELECDFAGAAPYRVVRVVGGPRRATVRVALDVARDARERWLDAREVDGWYGRDADDGSGEVWIVAERDGLAIEDLVRAGARLI
jgi:hypothetical protein